MLNSLVEEFAREAETNRSILLRMDIMDRLSRWLPAADDTLYNLYLNKRHPLERLRPADTFRGANAQLRSRAERAALDRANLHVAELARSGARFELAHLHEMNRLVRGETGSCEPGSTPYSPTRRAVTREGAGETLYAGAKPEDFEGALAVLVETLGTWRGPPLALAALAHYLLVFIHPFVDGNGRTARLLSSYVLLVGGSDMRHPALTQYYQWNYPGYYGAIDLRGDYYDIESGRRPIEKWMKFFLVSMQAAFREHLRLKMACGLDSILGDRVLSRRKPWSPVVPIPEGLRPVIDRRHRRRFGEVVATSPALDGRGRIAAWTIVFKGARDNNFRSCSRLFQYFDDGSWQPSDVELLEASQEPRC